MDRYFCGDRGKEGRRQVYKAADIKDQAAERAWSTRMGSPELAGRGPGLSVLCHLFKNKGEK